MGYKQRCVRCRKNFAVMTFRSRIAICEACQAQELAGEITDPAMKALFDIPPEYYPKSGFLRDIKAKYLRFGSLTERQIEAFKAAVARMREFESAGEPAAEKPPEKSPHPDK